MQLEDIPRTHETETKIDQCFVKLLPSSGLVRSLTGKVYLSMASSHTIIPMYYFLLYQSYTKKTTFTWRILPTAGTGEGRNVLKSMRTYKVFKYQSVFFFTFIVKATPFFRDRLIRMYSRHVNDSLAKNKFSTIVACSHWRKILGPCIASMIDLVPRKYLSESKAESSINFVNCRSHGIDKYC